MSTQVVTVEEGEGDFNFDRWVSQNGLTEIKGLFVKHNATTLQSLTITSQQFKSLMMDPLLFQKSYMIPVLMDSIQKLQNTKSTDKLIKILISDEEQQVMNNIESNLQMLNKIEKEMNKLKVIYPKSRSRIAEEKYTQIENVKLKITKIFNQLLVALNLKKENLLKEVEKIKNNVNKNENEDEDEKESIIFVESVNSIKETRNYLKEKHKICDQLTNNNNKRKQRKNKIIQIGRDVTNTFKENQQLLTQNSNNINKSIEQNESMIINIDFVVNNKKYDKITNNINQIGNIIYKTFQTKSEQNMNGNDDDIDDEKQVKQLKDEIIALQNAKKSMQTELDKKVKRINGLETNATATLLSLENILLFDVNDKYRWYKTEEKKDDNFVIVKINENNIGFIDGSLKRNISNNKISLSPTTTNMSDICKYLLQFKIISMQSLAQISVTGFVDFKGSKLGLTNNEKNIITKYLSQTLNNKYLSDTLLYDGARDGFGASQWHNKCDKNNNTLTIVETEYNHIFGCFASVAFDKSLDGRQSDHKSFLCLIRTQFKNAVSSKICPFTKGGKGYNGDYGPYSGENYGPCFGCSFDVGIFAASKDINYVKHASCSNYPDVSGNELCGGNQLVLDNPDKISQRKSQQYNFKIKRIETYKIDIK